MPRTAPRFVVTASPQQELALLRIISTLAGDNGQLNYESLREQQVDQEFYHGYNTGRKRKRRTQPTEPDTRQADNTTSNPNAPGPGLNLPTEFTDVIKDHWPEWTYVKEKNGTYRVNMGSHNNIYYDQVQKQWWKKTSKGNAYYVYNHEKGMFEVVEPPSNGSANVEIVEDPDAPGSSYAMNNMIMAGSGIMGAGAIWYYMNPGDMPMYVIVAGGIVIAVGMLNQ